MPIAKTCDYLAIQSLLGYSILSYIGNITDNKNQFELIEAMPELKKRKIVAVLAGREVDEGKVRNYLIKNNLSDSIVLAGFCLEMDSIWENVDLNVFLSKNDGFGLSIIEGYMRGIPSLMFDDLDANEDVRGKGLYLINRSENELVASIIKALDTVDQYTVRDIISNSIKYSLNGMTKEYMTIYEQILYV